MNTEGQTGTLFFFCGKMGAGKSTQAKAVATENNAILISEDEWLAAHYPNQIQTFDDYLALSRTIKPFIQAHVQNILATGTSVVMDFPANTVNQRAWFKALCSDADCEHEMQFLDLTDDQCLAQVAQRRLEQPERAHFDTAEVFAHVTRFFEPPAAEENLNILRIERG
ncbi:AAA family ATPase [Marinobacterium mangrovicola]|uniref:Shikimate kinase n=1 Tax=Marinobacterium mangrovicola TaxID=1476959 RepID=A0A4R1G7E8_9GAMM|nr:ATP-binding protein [Marinobacterium mangrovicola]TCK02601.1 shikimate kinase [Marinobacterium mangrovicola]